MIDKITKKFIKWSYNHECYPLMGLNIKIVDEKLCHEVHKDIIILTLCSMIIFVSSLSIEVLTGFNMAIICTIIILGLWAMFGKKLYNGGKK
jgi:hypothetical protein